MGGALCPPELMRNCRTKFKVNCLTKFFMKRILLQVDILPSYGCTETSPVTFCTGQDDTFEHKTTTVGSVLPHTEAKLTNTDDNGNEFIVNRNEIGELKVRGYWCGLLFFAMIFWQFAHHWFIY